MRKRVFGSIFLTSLVTLLLTTGLLLLAVHAGLTNDMRQRLITESSYLSAADDIREELEECGSVYADRLSWSRRMALCCTTTARMPPRWRTTRPSGDCGGREERHGRGQPSVRNLR